MNTSPILHYIFAENVTNSPTQTVVAPSDLYSKSKGYGFVTEMNRNTDETLQIPELNSGFEPWYWLKGDLLSHLVGTSHGIALSPSSTTFSKSWPVPLHFKCQVPSSGNYHVRIRFQNVGHTQTSVAIFTGRRRLSSYLNELTPHKTHTATFAVNISDIIPRGKTIAYKDDTFDLAIISSQPISLEEISLIPLPESPTLYIAGDSTVTDQNTAYPYHPSCAYCGWGQMLSVFCKDTITISNHAHSGLTTESFRSEGHYAIIEHLLKPGDFVLIQFAHNDQKLPELGAYTGYTERLKAYIEEIQSKGALPILVTPLARNTWRGDGCYNDLLADYANACIQLTKQYHIPLIDLHQFSKAFIIKHGLEASKAYFFPNDYTHTNDFGGLQMATYISKQLQSITALSPYIHDDLIYESIYLLLEQAKSLPVPVAPKDYIDLTHSTSTLLLPDIKGILYEDDIIQLTSRGIIGDREQSFRPKDLITRVELLEWIIKAVGFVPMNVYNDYYADVVGHEWYAGIVESAYQNQLVATDLTEGGLFRPLSTVTFEELISFLMTSYKCRKQVDLAHLKDYIVPVESVAPFAHLDMQLALQIGLIHPPIQSKLLLTREYAAHYVHLLLQFI